MSDPASKQSGIERVAQTQAQQADGARGARMGSWLEDDAGNQSGRMARGRNAWEGTGPRVALSVRHRSARISASTFAGEK